MIPDWSLTGKLGDPDKKSDKRFFLLHERPIKDQNNHQLANDDIWVYYESPSSSKTKSTAGYDEDNIIEYDNLDEALKEIENKVNNNKVKSLYLLSKK